MENTDIVLLKSGISSDVNILKPEEQEDILGGLCKPIIYPFNIGQIIG